MKCNEITITVDILLFAFIFTTMIVVSRTLKKILYFLNQMSSLIISDTITSAKNPIF